MYYAVGTKEVVQQVYDTEQEATQVAGPDQQVRPTLVGEEQKYAVVETIPIATYLKYSSVVLTNELLRQFPELKKLADFMRTNNAGEILFKSALKVGGPQSKVTFDQINKNTQVDGSYHGEIDNNFFKLQLNPKAKVDSNLAIFTQLMYFLNILGTNVQEADTAYATVAYLNNKNLAKIAKRFISPRATKGFIRSKMNDPASERYAEILSSGISINNPTVLSKALNSIMSGIESSVMKIKFPGAKLVLQSEQYITKKDGSRLKFVKNDETYYAEVILPKSLMSPEMQAMLDAGEDLYMTADFFGYRIPSTELHSAVPLKIVGTYDSVDTNVIIAPFELVYLHGSDFDVDSLFVPTREKASPTEANFLNLDRSMPLGYVKNAKGQFVWDGLNEQSRLIDKLTVAKTRANKLYNRYKNVNDVQADIFKKEIVYLDKLADQISEKIAKNLIIETMLSTITKPSNRARMFSPIVMANYNAVKIEGSIANYLDSLGLWPKTRLNDLSRMDQALKAFQSLQDGVRLTGIFANNIKVLAYLARAGKKNNSPSRVRKDLKFDFKLEGKPITFDRISDKDRQTGELTWMYQDGAVNLAIDNLKEQTLSKLGVNPLTGNAFSALVGLGFPIKMATLIMLNPQLKQIVEKSIIEGGDHRLAVNLEKAITEYNTAQDMPVLDIINNNSYTLSKADLETLAKGGEVADEVALAALGIFYKALKIGDSVRDLSGVLNVIRTIPTNFEDILKFNKSLNGIMDIRSVQNLKSMSADGYTKIQDYVQRLETESDNVKFKPSFAFRAPNFLKKNPHIAATLSSYFQALQIVQDNLTIYSKDVQDFITNIELPLNRFGARDVDQNVLTQELSKFIISSTIFNRLIKVSPLLNKRRKIFRTNIASFNAKFTETLSKLKKVDLIRSKEIEGHATNRFVQSLVTDASQGYPRIRMSGGTNLENVDIIELRADFIDLGKYTLDALGNPVYNPNIIPNTEVANELQQMFIDYIILATGFRLSSTSYSTIIPEAMYLELDNEYSARLDMLKRSPEFRQKVKPILEISLAIKYASELQRPSTAPVKGPDGNYAGKDGDIYYDRKYATNPKSTQEQNDKAFPKYVASYFPDLETNSKKYYVYVRISGTNQPYVYYRLIGKKRNDAYLANLEGYTNSNPRDNWSIETKFNPKVRDVQVFNIENKTMRTNQEVAKGEVVMIHSYDDLTRMNARMVEVGKLVSTDKNGFHVYKIKPVKQQTEISFAIDDPITEFLARVTNTSNNLKCN